MSGHQLSSSCFKTTGTFWKALKQHNIQGTSALYVNESIFFSKNENTAVCITSASNRLKAGTIKMNFDRAEVMFDRQKYYYVANPTVTAVDPEKGILSGGVMLKVKGTNLNAVQDPMMFARVKGMDYISVSIK